MNLRKMSVVFFFGVCLSWESGPISQQKRRSLSDVRMLTGYPPEQAEHGRRPEFAMEDLNARGGLLGRKVKVHVRDDEMARVRGGLKTWSRTKDRHAQRSGSRRSRYVHSTINVGDGPVQSNITPDYQHPKNMQPNPFCRHAEALTRGERMQHRILGRKRFCSIPTGLCWSIRMPFKVSRQWGRLRSIAVPSGTTTLPLSRRSCEETGLCRFIVNG
jgi:hypothetical protein